MESIVKRQQKPARLRKINIAEWRSAVAGQHGIRSIPQWWIYDGTRLVTKDYRAGWQLLHREARP